MAYVVTEACIKCKYTECVDPCPVDCFYEGANMLVIHPDECINCGACVSACPVEAIYDEEDLPEKWSIFKDINAEYSKKWPNINKSFVSLLDASEYADKTDKLNLFDSTPAKR